MIGGFIKAFRQIEEWEWYRDANTYRTFMHILYNANYRETTFRNVTIPCGSLATTYEIISQKLGISTSQARTAISHLKSTGEITVNITPKFMVVNVQNWAKYQGDEMEIDSQNSSQERTQIAPKSSKNRTQIAPLYEEEVKNKEEKNKRASTTHPRAHEEKLVFGEYQHVKLTQAQYDKLKVDYGNVDELVKHLDEWIEEKKYKSDNHNLAIRRWVVDAVEEKKAKKSNGKPKQLTYEEEIAQRTAAAEAYLKGGKV